MSLRNNPAIAVLLSISIGALVFAFAYSEPFFEWAFTRHQNILSWWARPLLIIPFCYFAYQRSINGMLLTILAILTSMFWFPVPEEVDPQALKFLEMEKQYLTSEWNIEKILWTLTIPLFFIGISIALWHRSIVLGIGIAVSGAMGKIIWSAIYNPDDRLVAAPFAIGGIIALLFCVFIFWYFTKRKET